MFEMLKCEVKIDKCPVFCQIIHILVCVYSHIHNYLIVFYTTEMSFNVVVNSYNRHDGNKIHTRIKQRNLSEGGSTYNAKKMAATNDKEPASVVGRVIVKRSVNKSHFFSFCMIFLVMQSYISLEFAQFLPDVSNKVYFNQCFKCLHLFILE